MVRPVVGTTGGTTDGGSQGSQSPDCGSTFDGETGEPTIYGEERSIAADYTFFYFSYDKSASTATCAMSLLALDSNRRQAPDSGRPYEFQNAERIEAFDAQAAGPFSRVDTMRRAEYNDLPIAGSIEGRLCGVCVDLAGPNQQPEQNATYARYRRNIERFCEQVAPYDNRYR